MIWLHCLDRLRNVPFLDPDVPSKKLYSKQSDNDDRWVLSFPGLWIFISMQDKRCKNIYLTSVFKCIKTINLSYMWKLLSAVVGCKLFVFCFVFVFFLLYFFFSFFFLLCLLLAMGFQTITLNRRHQHFDYFLWFGISILSPKSDGQFDYVSYPNLAWINSLVYV